MIVALARVEAARLAWRVVCFLLLCALGGVLAIASSGCLAGAGLLVLGQQPPGAGGFAVVPDGTLLPDHGPIQPSASSAAVRAAGTDAIALLQASATQAPCVVAWPVLAGVATVEDASYGATHAIGPAIALRTGLVIHHAYGPAQFLIDTWNSYGDQPIARTFAGGLEQPPEPSAHIWQPESAYPALARYLCALGVASDPIAALWRYSGCLPGPGCGRTDRYPFQVLAIAARFGVVEAPPTSPLADQLLAEARTWLGTRYVFGGCSRSGIDCSCFVQTIYRTVGVQLPRTTQAQYDATIGRGSGTPTPVPGALAFFRQTYLDPAQLITHVGIVTRVNADGSVWMIDAPGARAAGDPPDAPDGQVREEPIAGFWSQHLAGFATVLPMQPLPTQG